MIDINKFAFSLLAIIILFLGIIMPTVSHASVVIVVPFGENKDEYRKKYMEHINDLRILIVQAHQAGLVVPISVLSLVGQETSNSKAFTLNLSLGDRGYEVVALQNFLRDQGYSIPQETTGTFDMETQAALAAYQAASGVSPANGYFGSKTRAHIKIAVEKDGK